VGLLDRFKKRAVDILPKANEDCPSVVLLLRESQTPTEEQALEMARSAWGAAGPVEIVGSIPPHTYAIRASELFLALHAVPRCYEASPPISGDVQRQCWDQHGSWLSVDMPTAKVTELRESRRLGEAYFSLLFFAHRHRSPNCLALYFPAEGVTVPNQGNPVDSIRWSLQNGANLDFLRREKKE
jgi:hypothetical protein